MIAPTPHHDRIATLIAAFKREYGRAPEGIAEAPGRVNLIGEHVDYNDGLVLPFAIDRSVLCAWAHGTGATFRAGSSGFADRVEFGSAPVPPRDGTWADYVRAVVSKLPTGSGTSAVDLRIESNVPQGAGLSSSAALEVAIAGALRDASTLNIDDVELAQLCQRAENEYVGVQCGIMDQFTSALARRGHALLIDCRTLAYEHVPLRLEDAGLAVVIANSAVSRELAGSAYNDRRRECEAALQLLRTRLGRPDLASLRDVSIDELASIAIDSVPLRRVRHVVTEIARVATAVEALRSDDFDAVGALMAESHRSLRDDYEVSSPQLDLLVELAAAQDYVLGARLTGAGFGGCTVNIVRSDAVSLFERDVIDEYRSRTGLPAEIYVTTPQDGLRTRRL